LYGSDLRWGITSWIRLGEKYPSHTLKGSSPSWLDAVQGYLGNCYALAAVGALAEFPSLIDKVFLNDINSSGIYALKLYIRGKPWIITIDD
jgi:hypothetical protein